MMRVKFLSRPRSISGGGDEFRKALRIALKIMHNSYRVGIFDLCRAQGGQGHQHSSSSSSSVGSNEDRSKSSSTSSENRVSVYLTRCLVAAFLVDVSISTVCLFAYRNFDVTNISEVFEIKREHIYDHSVSDIFYLALCRMIVLPSLAYLAVRVTRLDFGKKDESTLHRTQEQRNNSLKDPLLGSGDDDDDRGVSSKQDEAFTLRIKDEEEAKTNETCVVVEDWKRGQMAVKDMNDSSLQDLKNRAAVRKNIVLAIMFVFSTGAQVYSGIKCLDFAWNRYGGSEDIIAPLVTATVFAINVEVWLLRELVSDVTRDAGLYMKSIHQHPLFFDQGIARHWCNLCGQRVNKAFRCKLCDFDACSKCVSRKRTANAGENLIRSDKGVVDHKVMSTTEYFFRAMKLTGPESKLFLFAFLFLVLTAIATLALPNTQGEIINKIIENDKSSFLLDLRLYVGIMFVMGIFNGIKGLLFTIVARRIAFHARTKLFDAILKQDVAFFDGTTSGRLTSRLTNDIGMMLSPIQSTLSTMLYNIVMLIGGVAMCFYTSYQLSMLAFTTVGPILYLWDLYANWSRRLNRMVLAALSEANSVAVQALGHVRTVKAFSQEAREIDDYVGSTRSALTQGIKDAWGYAFTSAVTNYLDLGAGMLILSVGGLLILSDNGPSNITVGSLVAFQMYWQYMNSAYQSLQNIVTSFTRAAAAAERVFTLMDMLPDIDNADNGKPIDFQVRGHLELKDVCFHYQMRPERQVLKNLSLSIPAGSVVALVGRSGGGKSTIVSMLLRFYDPRKGQLMLDGRDVRTFKIADYRRLFGIVAQETSLFARTIRENICYGTDPSRATEENMIEAAKRARAYEFIKDLPEQFDTRVGERGLRISGGQRQRIALARVFLRKPKILLLDEATSALDAENESMVQMAIDELIERSGSTVVLVAHRLSTVINADIIAVVDKGRIVESGNHTTLMGIKNGIYASLVKKQLAKSVNTIDEDAIDDASTKNKENSSNKGKHDDNIDNLLDAIEAEGLSKPKDDAPRDDKESELSSSIESTSSMEFTFPRGEKD